MKAIHKIAFVLVIIGALDWGLMAIGYYMSSNWNVVNLIFGSWPSFENLIYLLVGISALLLLFKKKENYVRDASESINL
ncbi:MAG: DUF378 domain-containing protein [Candidatus Kaiserbacteria bacterium]|nr:DUF378 domain-containing protein [Candidatus Kaiserbacteria bacterium]